MSPTLRTFAVTATVVGLVAIAIAIFPLATTEHLNADAAFDRPLHIPPLLEGDKRGDIRQFELSMQKGQLDLGNGKVLDTMGFGGPYLGPTLKANKGELVRITVANALDQTSTVHWHGMILPASEDGGPHQPIAPAASWTAEWPILNEAATYWYHPHTLHRTGEEVYSGLAGLFVIYDDSEAQRALPSKYGVDDIPLILQDRVLGENTFEYDPRPADFMGNPGMLGDTLLVNGVLAPYVEVPRGLMRLRVLNGSNARRYNLGFQDNRNFRQVASDGGLLPSAADMKRLTLAPGERAEIVVDLSQSSEPIRLVSYPIFDPNPVLAAAKAVVGLERDEGQRFDILELRPEGSSVEPTPLPDILAELPERETSDVADTWRIELAGNRINGRVMDQDRVDRVVAAGSREIWEIHALDAPHPFHIHGVQFRVLDRDGKEPPPGELGWKDTVLVHQGETVRILVDMPKYSDARLPFMFHCHILEHEDAGMMGQFTVVSSNETEEDVET